MFQLVIKVEVYKLRNHDSFVLQIKEMHRERERVREKVCVCVCERERKRERERF
jgi:hypothetical protein